jgi:Tfp pilus assembly protein PilF
MSVAAASAGFGIQIGSRPMLPSTDVHPMESLEKSPTRNSRLWWLIACLLLTLNVLAWQRKSIAGWVGRLAMARASQDQRGAADRYLGLAERISQDVPEVALAAARLHRRQGDMVEFGRQLRRAYHLGIASELADRERVLAAAQSGQMSVARPQLLPLLDTAGGDEAEICEAYAKGYMRTRDFAAALALLDGWATDFPTDARPHAWIGQIHTELQATEAAETAFRKALELDPDNASAALGLGQLLVNLKRHAEAAPLFRIATTDPAVGVAAAVGLANCLQAESQVGAASEVLSAALLQFPSDYRLIVEKANLEIEQGRFTEAEAALKPEIEAGTRRREIRYAYGMALRGLGKLDEATEHFEYAAEAAKQTGAANRRIGEVATSPDNVELRFEIGETQLRYGNIEDGLMWLQSVLDIDPNHRPTHRALAEYYESEVFRNPRMIALAQRHRLLAGPAVRAH